MTNPEPIAVGAADLPSAWKDLIEALILLARGRCDDVSPFNCIHDQLGVMADQGQRRIVSKWT